MTGNHAPLLEVRGLSRSFDKIDAVSDLSFRVERGSITGFIGPNGSGKTTTMKIVSTLDVPTAGDVFLDGESVLVYPDAARRRLGFMADQFSPYPDMDVLQYLDFFARAFGLRGAERQTMIKTVIDFCGLGTFLDRSASAISKGMSQRLHLAKTLLHDPPLLLLDEPAAGLDPRARVELRALLKELAATGKGVLISSHILSELSEICDAVVMIELGKLVIAGQTRDIARQMREHHTVEVAVLSGADRAERVLLVQPMVREVVVEDERTIRFDYLGDEDGMASVLKALVDAGVPVYRFLTEEADLEEVFLRATKGRLQ